MQTLISLLSVFISPWQFFKESVPSPRIEITLSKTEEESYDWQEFCLRPKQLSTLDILKSIFFNARWNESLFITDCAERLILDPTEYNKQEIVNRIKFELERIGLELKMTPYLQFRLIFVTSHGTKLQGDILYVSKIEKIFGDQD